MQYIIVPTKLNVALIFFDDFVTSGYHFMFDAIAIYEKKHTDLLMAFMHALTTVIEIKLDLCYYCVGVIDYNSVEGKTLFDKFLDMYPDNFEIYGGSALNFAIACYKLAEKNLGYIIDD